MVFGLNKKQYKNQKKKQNSLGLIITSLLFVEKSGEQ